MYQNKLKNILKSNFKMEKIYFIPTCPHCKKELGPKILVDNVFRRSLTRFKIIHLLRKYKKLNITELSEKVGVSRPVIYYHINKMKEIETEKLDKKGKPVIVFLRNHDKSTKQSTHKTN